MTLKGTIGYNRIVLWFVVFGSFLYLAARAFDKVLSYIQDTIQHAKGQAELNNA